MMHCMSKKDLYKDAKSDDIEIVGDHIEIDPPVLAFMTHIILIYEKPKS
jgi:hypothetical protein